ncbi:ankyrin repeat domain-containing protein [Brachyspira hyodysenteriae]|nr:ankyrin repeat domain-containing protein [Brachyspira hyodysenteriae]MDA1470032.1 ankyrin repeat domain-containing protein [Brachyspira hyodysenteriae]
MLINNNADVNAYNNNGTTALMYACLMLKEDIITELLKHNADINKKDNNGDNAFDYLNSNGKREETERIYKMIMSFNNKK